MRSNYEAIYVHISLKLIKLYRIPEPQECFFQKLISPCQQYMHYHASFGRCLHHCVVCSSSIFKARPESIKVLCLAHVLLFNAFFGNTPYYIFGNGNVVVRTEEVRTKWSI